MLDTLISVAEDFCQWLEAESEKYNIDKDEIQAIITEFLHN